MKNNNFYKSTLIRSLGSALFLVAIFALAASAARAQEKNKVSDKAGDDTFIRANVKQMETGWNMKSGAEFAKPFAGDADYVVINGMHVKGRAAIAQGHQQIFDTVYKDSNLTLVVEQIRFLRPDVAVAHVQTTLRVKQADSVSEGVGRITMVMMKTGDKWEIAAFQNTAIQAMGGK
ncbi:MAG: SgcJ/EcaC family oxidoreductase [Pyrinomonadaceae bacterium]